VIDLEQVKRRVREKWQDAYVGWNLGTFEYVVWSCDDPSQRSLGRGPKRYAAWQDAAHRLDEQERSTGGVK
jgi:hypothetical protein